MALPPLGRDRSARAQRCVSARLAHFRPRRWDQLPLQQAEDEEEELWAFEEAHDLSRAFRGARFPKLWVLKQGQQAYVEARGSGGRYLPWAETLKALEDLVSHILERLDPLPSDERARAALSAWHERENIGSRRFISIATSIEEDALSDLDSGAWDPDYWELADDGFEVTEVVAVARMAATISSSSALAALLDRVRDTPRTERRDLDQMTRAVFQESPFEREARSYEQGYAVAEWLRRRLCADAARIDPHELLESWGVFVEEVDLGTSQIDAVSVWGPRHGPTVFLNQNQSQSPSTGRQRATLAHEICHLLLDRGTALPLAEVLGGRAPEAAEVRARAFQAELLVPRDVAGRSAENAPEIGDAITELAKHYGASHELVAWQIHNSNAVLPKAAWDELGTLVQSPMKIQPSRILRDT